MPHGNEKQPNWEELKEQRNKEMFDSLVTRIGQERAERLKAEVEDIFDHVQTIASENPGKADIILASVKKLNNEIAQVINGNETDPVGKLEKIVTKLDTTGVFYKE